MAVASLVLGIISIIIGAVSGGLVGWLGAILAIIGIVLEEKIRSIKVSLPVV